MSDCKIVINTCVRFRECLNKCFESLIENVKDFKKYQDVIVVIGGCERMEEPKLIPIRNITDLNSDLEVVVIKTPVNNFDFNALDALYVFTKENPHSLIASPYYFYTLDTTTFKEDFIARVNDIPRGYDIVTGPNPFSFIMFFSDNYLNFTNKKFADPMHKWDVIRIEHGHEWKNIHYDTVGNSLKYGERFNTCDPHKNRFPIYEGLAPRTRFDYPKYGVYKYVKWDSVLSHTQRKP